MGGPHAVEEAPPRRCHNAGTPSRPAEIDHILDVTIAYVEAGMAAVADGDKPPAPA